tara:strand:+ start:3140 stop:4366 length:1227 start_codon:yes stop_codon:yes gene_type:complete
MSLKKFDENDVFINTMKAYPHNEFVVFNSKIYWNSVPAQSGARNNQVRNVPSGYVSLYEYNIDRPKLSTGRSIETGSILDTGRIYPWISKDTAGGSFKTVSTETYQNEFQWGDVLTGSYPLSASITREYITRPYYSTASYNKHYMSLRNRLNFYGLKSQHYNVTSAFGNKDRSKINLVSIPSIFYGSQIKPGSVSLKWYFTGSLIGELRDTRQNGELIQVGPRSSLGSGSVAGVVLYNEGFVLLTGSWALNTETIRLTTASFSIAPQWLHYGAGANDGISTSTAGATYASASFSLSFKGTTETQVVTMLAKAKRGEVNYSNNPTFLKYGQTRTYASSSQIFEEPTDVEIKNCVSSSFNDYEVPFKRQVYISRVGIYDENKNLIGMATLANPVLKESGRDLAFKIKVDI